MTLKEEYQQKTSKLLEKHGVFWAFNEEQLREGINNIASQRTIKWLVSVWAVICPLSTLVVI